MRLKRFIWRQPTTVVGDCQAPLVASSRPAEHVFAQPRFIHSGSTVLIIPLSSTKAAARFAATLPITKNVENGLNTDSVILVFQIRVLDRSRFGQRIGKVGQALLTTVYETLDRLTGRTRTQATK